MPPNTSPIILGIDPGYDRLGWAVGTQTRTKNISYLGYGCITTDKKQSQIHRLASLQISLNQILEHFKPQEVAIEAIFFSKNKTTAIKVAEAKGVIISCCLSQTRHIFEYTPPNIKLAVTGKGNASKKEVHKMMTLQTKENLSNQLDDAIDAMAVVMTHCTQRKLQQKIKNSR